MRENMTGSEKYDLYTSLHLNPVTCKSEKVIKYSNYSEKDYYYFGPYTILYETQISRGCRSFLCIRIFILKNIKDKTVIIDYWNSFYGNTKKYIHDMYIAAKNKLYNRPYNNPYKNIENIVNKQNNIKKSSNYNGK